MGSIVIRSPSSMCSNDRSAEVRFDGGVRTGAVVLEAVLAIPILVIIVMACVQFGTTMIVEQAILAGVTEGAREGAKVPTTLSAADGNRILSAVQTTESSILSTQGISLANTQIIVEDSSGIRSSGPAVGPVPVVTTITDPAEVRVTVRVELVNTSIPDLLSTFGLNLTTRNFSVVSVSRRD
jgi:Flp pilus assembly protein TadG